MSRWLERHPLLRDALLWSIPALLVGAALRIMLIHSSPYAFFGADSRSFMGFTNGVFTDFYFSINEKRRYLYPLFLFPISFLPGGTLRWLAGIQALLGLVSILPIAYVVRRTFLTWRWFIIPVTVLLAGMPVFLWFEHELIADTIFFDCMNWALAGWVAWTSQTSRRADHPSGRKRACRLWWWFWVPFAIMLLTKPSGKLLWPGVVIGLLLVGAWHTLRWPQWTAVAALFLASLTVGDENQSSWLLYTSAFPFTQLDTPLHAEYKAGIRDLVLEKRARFSSYHNEDDKIHDFLRSPEDRPEFPKWAALSKPERDKLYKDLAFEAIKARPDLFALLALQRLGGSCNQDDFKTSRFHPHYYAQHLHQQYYGRVEPSMLRIAFGVPSDAPYPSYKELCAWVTPRPDAFSTRFILDYSDAYQSVGDLFNRDANRLTFLGWWVILGAALSLIPPFLKPLGTWTIAFGGYLFAVYLIGTENHRYFALVWPMILILLAVVPEALWRSASKNFQSAPPK